MAAMALAGDQPSALPELTRSDDRVKQQPRLML